MGIKNDCRRNAEGYSDPTAYEALKNMEQEEERNIVITEVPYYETGNEANGVTSYIAKEGNSK